jgi:hypothetical protein
MFKNWKVVFGYHKIKTSKAQKYYINFKKWKREKINKIINQNNTNNNFTLSRENLN